MKKVILGLLLLTSLKGSLSDVAFTTQSDMSKKKPHVTKNELFKNDNPTTETKECKYFRDFEVVYNFETEEKKHIYYYMFQCLDNDFSVLKSNVTFNYDGGENRMHLPDGCIPPSIPETPDNPCQHGFDLGTEVIKDVSTMITKKLINHPQEIPQKEITMSIDANKLDEVNQKLPELAKLLDDLLEKNHASNPENRKIEDSITNEDGTVTHIYHFANGDVAEKTKKDNGDVETILYNADETVEVKTEMPSGVTDVTLYDKEGIAVYHKSIEPIEGNPDYVKITTFNYDDEIVGEPEIYPKFESRPVPLDIEFDQDTVNKLDDANKLFASAIENYVNERVTCFSENLINVKESYLTFVCSTTGHASIKDIIQQNFAETLMCGGNIDCDAIEEELVDKMLTSINMGGDGHGVSVETNVKNQTILDGHK
jgi:hypothetical protein